MQKLERHEHGWRFRADGLKLNIDHKTGCLPRPVIVRQVFKELP